MTAHALWIEKKHDHRSGEIVPLDGTEDGVPIARTWWGNILCEHAPESPWCGVGAGGRLITFTGSLAGDLNESHPHNWGQPGAEALQAWIDAQMPGVVQRDQTLLLCPHVRHVISDGPSALALLARQEGEAMQRVQIALSPAVLLEASMLRDGEDHLRRIFDQLGSRCAMLLLSDAVVDEATGLCRPVPLGEGVLPGDLLRELVQMQVPTEVPLVLLDDSMDRQVQWWTQGSSTTPHLP